MVTSLKRGRPK